MHILNLSLSMSPFKNLREMISQKAEFKNIGTKVSKIPDAEFKSELTAKPKTNSIDFVYDNKISYVAGFSIEEKDMSVRMIVLFVLFVLLDIIFLIWFYVKVRNHQRKIEESSERQISLTSI